MTLRCRLRQLRGKRSLREMEQLTGIHRGYLSRYERGKELPRDHHVQILEKHYGSPFACWYREHVTVELRDDNGQRLTR